MNENKIIVALDVETAVEARQIISELRGEVGAFKIGLQLFAAAGASFVREAAAMNVKIFLDLKFHDIPNTVAKASIEATRMGVWMFNVHAFGGGEMMRRTVDAVRQICAKENARAPKIIAITVLTSSGQKDLRAVGIQTEVKQQVVNLARLASDCGMDGVVASPREVRAVRQAVEDENFLIVTPGIRSKKSKVESRETASVFETCDDQKRVMSAGDAVRAGASYIVVGRPILQSKNRVEAARRILEEIKQGTQTSISGN